MSGPGPLCGGNRQTSMSYASYAVDTPAVGAAPTSRADFHRSERLITIVGACALGGAIGFAVAVAIGRTDMWALFLSAAVLLAVALYPASANVADASGGQSKGCTLAAMAHIVAILAWPVVVQFAGGLFWLVPAIALSSLVLLASCWNGQSRAVYRMGLQGLLIAALGAHQATMLAMGA